MREDIGQQIGNYRLLKLLGRGNTAEVYLCQHVHLETQAALKLLHVQLTDEKIREFSNEARTIARLEHPHIVRIFDFGVQEEKPFLAMSYAPNGTLRQRHPRGQRLPLSQVILYVKQVAAALYYAHQQRIIHRDIKPENLLLDAQEQILLSDFGTALITSDSQALRTQDTAGTIAYMAPEQLNGHPQPASDQYGLGVLTYEWLSGQRPFEGNFTEIALRHSKTPVPSLRARVPQLPPAVEEVVLTALHKDPDQRFATIQAFAVALEQSEQQAAISAVVSSPAGQSGSSPTHENAPETPIPASLLTEQQDSGTEATIVINPRRITAQQQSVALAPPLPTPPAASPVRQQRPLRTRRALLLGIGGGIAALGVVGAIAWFARPPAATRPPIIASTATTPLPVGEKIAYSGFGFDPQRTHFNQNERRLSPTTVAQLEQLWVTQTGATINCSPVIAHDTVYIGSDDRRLYALDTETGKARWTLAGKGRIYSSPTVDDTLVYFASQDGTLAAADALTGKVAWSTLLPNQLYASPLLVNDMLYIGSFDTKLYAFAANSGKKLWETATDAYLVSSPAFADDTLYIGSGSGRVYAFRAKDGTQLWTTSIGSRITSSPAIANGLVYIGSSDTQLYALEAATGKIRWKASTGDVVASSPAVANGLVYIGSPDTHIYAFDAASGEQRWKTTTYNQVNSSPTVANGIVYVGSWDGLVYGCDASSGKVLWTGYTNDHVFSSPAVVNGVVYIGSWDTKIYAFHLPQ